MADDTARSATIHDPLTLRQLSRALLDHGVTASVPTLYRWAREGLIATTRLGTTRSTVHAVLTALRPDAGKAADQ